MKKIIVSLLLYSFTLCLDAAYKNYKSSREIINELKRNTQVMNKLILSVPDAVQLITTATKIDNRIKDLEKKMGITELEHKRSRIIRKIYESDDEVEQEYLRNRELRPLSDSLRSLYRSLKHDKQFIKLYKKRKKVTKNLNASCIASVELQLKRYSALDIELSSELCSFSNNAKLLHSAQQINSNNLFYKYCKFYSII